MRNVPERVTAKVSGDFVVFRIGMRINTFWKVHKWLPVFLAMPRMLRELEEDPDSGLLGYQQNLGIRNHMLLQYWRSFEHLREYARAADNEHLAAWKRFNREFGSNGDIGIWHETFLIRDGEYEAVYNNMPPFGLERLSSWCQRPDSTRQRRDDSVEPRVTTLPSMKTEQ